MSSKIHPLRSAEKKAKNNEKQAGKSQTHHILKATQNLIYHNLVI